MSNSSPKSLPSQPHQDDILIILKHLGVPSEFIPAIASSLGKELFAILEKDPYSLCERIGASFLEVEAFALQHGFSLKNPSRLRAGILYLLACEESDGNCFSIQQAFLRYASRFLSVETSVLSRVIQVLSQEGRLEIKGEHLRSKNLSDIEEEVARRILLLCQPIDTNTESPLPVSTVATNT